MTKEVEDAVTDSNSSGGRRPRARDNNSCSACPQQKYETATTTITLSTASFLSQMNLFLSLSLALLAKDVLPHLTQQDNDDYNLRECNQMSLEKCGEFANHAQATNHF